MTTEELLTQALACGFTAAQYKALTAPQRIAFLHAAAVAKSAAAHAIYSSTQTAMAVVGVETQRIYAKRLIVGGALPLLGEVAK